MASMLKLARAGAALTGTAVALVVAAAPAGADAASGVVDRGADVAGFPVNVGDGAFAALDTSLIGFRLTDGSVLGMYCVEISTEIDEEQDMVERPWEEFPAVDSPFLTNQDRINWVLHNGFPVREPDALTALLTEAGTELADGIDEREAVTATQAAVWHFSDGTDLDREDPLPGADSDEDAAADVLALYDFLTGEENVGMTEQPAAALGIEPDDLAGSAGERIGPFTVSTSGEIAELAAELPDGVLLTDAEGTELDPAAVTDGTEVFVAVPQDAAAGEATFTITATAVVDTGRLFVGEDYYEQATQSLIVARAVESSVTATGRASWTQGVDVSPAAQGKNTDDGGLAFTGASIFGPILLGAVLLGTGILSVFFVRGRRRA